MCGHVSAGLPSGPHSRALSHYHPPRRLLAAGFPPWPGAPLLSQPGAAGLPPRPHIDGGLSADARSPWVNTDDGESRPQHLHTSDPREAELQETPRSQSRYGAKIHVHVPLADGFVLCSTAGGRGASFYAVFVGFFISGFGFFGIGLFFVFWVIYYGVFAEINDFFVFFL